jgi:hypothetical protein
MDLEAHPDSLELSVTGPPEAKLMIEQLFA